MKKIEEVDGEEITPSNEVEEKADTENKEIKLTKTTTSKPANGEFYVKDEVITYEVKVENKGNIAQTITVSDPNADEADEIVTLAKAGEEGDNTVVNFTHKVTDADVIATKITNTATGKVDGEETIPSNEVVVESNEYRTINVRKDWIDAENQEGLRAEVIVQLLADGVEVPNQVVTLDGTKLTEKFEGLPKYKEGKEIDYSIAEKTTLNNYEEPKYEGDASTELTVTNKLDYSKYSKSITMAKVWDDSADQDGIRPENIKVQIKRGVKDTNGNINYTKYQEDTIAGSQEDVTVTTIEEKAAWVKVYDNLPKYNENGKEYFYTIVETKVGNDTVTNNKTNNYEVSYSSTITTDATVGNTTGAVTITNTHEPATTEVTVTKVWEDNNDADSKRPTDITIKLYDGNTAVKNNATVAKNGNTWTYRFTELPVFDNGRTITYTAKELKASGEAVENNELYNDDYKSTYSRDTLTITNTYLKPVFRIVKEGNPNSGSTVEPGTTVEYTIKVYNDGNIAGEKLVVDSDLKTLIGSKLEIIDGENTLSIKDYDTNGNARSNDNDESKKTINDLANGGDNGVKVNVPADSTKYAEITFKLKVSGNIGDTIENNIEGSKVTYTVGKDITIKKYAGSKTPANYVLIVDCSGSMLSHDMKDENGNEITRLDSEKNAISNFVKALYEDNSNNQSTVTIIKFGAFANEAKANGKTTFGVADYAVDSNGNLTGAFKTLIDNIEVKLDGGTNISAGLSKAKSYMYDTYSGIHAKNSEKLGKDNNKDVFIVLSDGMPNKGSINKDALKGNVETLMSAKPSGITNQLHTIAFGKETTNETPTGKKVQEILVTMATAGKGKKYDAANQSELFETLLQISYELKETTTVAMDGNSHTIYNGTNTLKKLSVTYKQNGTTKSEDYNVKTTGNVGPFVYSKEGNNYKLVFNGTDYLDKEDVIVSYYY